MLMRLILKIVIPLQPTTLMGDALCVHPVRRMWYGFMQRHLHRRRQMVLQSLWHTMLNAFLDNPFAVLFGILAQPFSRILPYLHLVLGLHYNRVIGGDIHRTETNYFFFPKRIKILEHLWNQSDAILFACVANTNRRCKLQTMDLIFIRLPEERVCHYI
jgi:hypothetical protein